LNNASFLFGPVTGLHVPAKVLCTALIITGEVDIPQSARQPYSRSPLRLLSKLLRMLFKLIITT
jgi:hypothetical protein